MNNHKRCKPLREIFVLDEDHEEDEGKKTEEEVEEEEENEQVEEEEDEENGEGNEGEENEEDDEENGEEDGENGEEYERDERGDEDEEEENEEESEEGEEKDQDTVPQDWHIEYPDLYTATSQQNKGRNAGLGVYANRNLNPWECLKVNGIPLKSKAYSQLEKLGLHTHIVYTNDGLIDCHPRHQPWEGIGGRGFFIAGLVNEPTNKKPNMILRGNYYIVAQPIRKGDELLVSYGPAYHRNYSVSRYCKEKQEYPHLAIYPNRKHNK